MNCVLYSMEKGKVVISDIKAARIRSSLIKEIFIFKNHQPIIGDIEEEFEIIHTDSSKNETFYVNTGFFEFNEGVLTIVANFKEIK